MSSSVSVQSFALVGVDAVPVTVEVDLLRRLPCTQIVGMSSASVREAAERVRSAVHAAGFEWPRMRVVVNLAPADLRKDGTAFDLPIALAVLAAAGHLDPDVLKGRVFAGELSIAGDLRPIRGTVAAASVAGEDLATLMLPAPNAATCAGLGPCVLGFRSLAHVVGYLQGSMGCEPESQTPSTVAPSYPMDFSEVRGNPRAIRAALIAVAGGHHLAMVGAPGCGKTMIAARIPGIFPAMDLEQRAEVARVHDAAGLLQPGSPLPSSRPFRAPHHSISSAGMLGGSTLRPGEVSLAHGGVLFLDEAPEFMRHVLELVRDPLREGHITVQRALGSVRMPARFTLVTASNPCPCGFHGHPRRVCACSQEAVERYQARADVLHDLCDVRVTLEPVPGDSLLSTTPGPTSASLREQVEKVWAKWVPAPMDAADIYTRAMSREARKAYIALEMAAENLPDLDKPAESRRLNRLVRVALTIAHLAGCDEVIPADIEEAATFTA